MTREQFDAMIARIERRFADRPLALKLRVALSEGLVIGVVGSFGKLARVIRKRPGSFPRNAVTAMAADAWTAARAPS
jgi:hypothetical protein